MLTFLTYLYSLWKYEAAYKIYIYNSRHVASRKRTYSQALPPWLIGQTRRPCFAHPRFDWMNKLSLTYVRSNVMRQVKTKEAWPLCCEGLGSSREGFASMLPLQSVRVTSRLFILTVHVAARSLKLNLCHEGSRLHENCTFALSFSLHQPQVSTWGICGSILKLTFFLSLVVWTQSYSWTSDRIRLLFLLKRKYWKKN